MKAILAAVLITMLAACSSMGPSTNNSGYAPQGDPNANVRF